MPVSDPESSRPATCAGAGLASTRFPDSSHGAAGTWLGMWGTVGRQECNYPNWKIGWDAAVESPLVKACRLKLRPDLFPLKGNGI